MTAQAFIQQFQQIPESLRQELLEYYQYLLFKYKIQIPAQDKTGDELPVSDKNTSELQKLLLAAPPFTEEDNKIIEQKREIINTWKPYSSTQAY
jgi:hypothetical protein